jgi:hypothetical protein
MVMQMQYSVDPTLLLESDDSTKVVIPMQYLDDPTLLIGIDVSTDYVFSISSLVLLEKGDIFSTSIIPPSSPRMVSFDCNDLVEPHLPYYMPFKRTVEFNSKNIYRCIVHEGDSTSILSFLDWKPLGSPELVTALHELLDFDRCPNEYLGILPQFPISLGGNIFLVYVIVVQGPLYFNMLLGCDYVYAMNVAVFTLFRVMDFPHNGSIFTIDQSTSDNHHPNLALVQATPLYIKSIHVDSTLPHVNYVVSYPPCSISLQ